ncbi:uncharacterized protein [Lolium perenne]|uniref:uncharacterized protein n=1 Tax=Lolium perenne TaxID=4522 RepID=UPI0021F5BDD3|nr:uncharacterized protein LOC127292632 [Lolium perenne]
MKSSTYCSCNAYVWYSLVPWQSFIHSWCHSIHLEALVCSQSQALAAWRLQCSCKKKGENGFEDLLHLLLPPRPRFRLHQGDLNCYRSLRLPPAASLIGLASSVTMSKQPSSRNHGGKRLRPGQCIQVFLLVAVSIWLVYQLGHCFKRRALAVKIGGSRGVGGEPIRRRWLDRKSLIKFAGAVSGEVASGISGGGITATNDDAVGRKPRTSEGREDEGDQDDDGLFGYDAGDDSDFNPENGEGEENSELDTSTAHRVNTTGRAQDGGADQLLNGAPDGNRSLNTSNLRTDLSSGMSLTRHGLMVLILFRSRSSRRKRSCRLLFTTIQIS